MLEQKTTKKESDPSLKKEIQYSKPNEEQRFRGFQNFENFNR